MQVNWCKNCQSPIINQSICQCGEETKYLATDIRPVFTEERYLLYYITKNDSFLDGNVWASKSFKYYLNGKPFSLGKKDLSIDINHEYVKNEAYRYTLNESDFDQEIRRFVYNNRSYLQEKEFAAFWFIEDTIKKYAEPLAIVSFSGGKDSTLVSHLTCRALSNPSIIHLFGDTTLEFPLTYNYLSRFRKANPRIPFLVSKSEHGFFDLCQTLGPPSRVMSWCCTVFKTGPMNGIINSLAKEKTLLNFYGIRGSESFSRSEYQKTEFSDFLNLHKISSAKISPKIYKQIVSSPIFDWKDADVWLYIFAHKLDFNDSYRLGYTRVGCWCCPNNSEWSSFLTSIYMPNENAKWNNFLIDFARRIGKPDPDVYIKTGKWKARQGGAGLISKQINLEAKPCIGEEFSRTIVLTKPISEELYEYFKPFGNISKELGRKILNETIVVDRDTNQPLLMLQGKERSYNLKITAVNPSNYHLLTQRIDCQLKKYQSCIGCLGCVSVCPEGAITYVNNYYRILEHKCKSCLNCINPWNRGGCLMTKILAVKKGES